MCYDVRLRFCPGSSGPGPDRSGRQSGVFEHDHTSCWEVNINAHYLINLRNNQLYFYPLAGLNYTMAKYKEDGVSEEKNHVGLNVGAGIEFEINEHFGANLEYRHTIVRKVDQGVIGLGINYKF